MLRTHLGAATGPASQRLVAHRPGFRANKAPRAPQTTVTRASPDDVPALVDRAQGISLVNSSGEQKPFAEIVRGKSVEQASNLLSLKPQFEAAGYKLVVTSIGTAEKGKEFCEKKPFPEENLWLDTPEGRPLYRALALKDGVGAFLSPEMIFSMSQKDMNKFVEALRTYAPSLVWPGNIESTAQMGGLYVFDGPKVLFSHQDPGVGAHAKNEDVLNACCAGASA
ncbi:hypothetical protein DUNSADRAFT_8320 [Dunaliella salina]|uniref:Uncharacterized protein n=1 Tax=Dunaliella salina TaxID=3046 RepID=A0ABQ7H5Y3_DUNSA|nr:hypothetical protein DUNSADRAFT_8320 [Dunaliella salina]|eukprot:KAF5842257.1 hypothetical protein DUNSADRAFT_8320 [Dunaliella salina]